MSGTTTATYRLAWLALLCCIAVRPTSGRDAAGQACSITPTALGFGNVILGEEATEILTITNTGASAAVVTPALTGPNAARFEVDTTPITIPVSGSRDLEVRFSPNSVNAFGATLGIDCDGSMVNVALSGSGIPLLVVVTPVTVPIAGQDIRLAATLPEGYQPDTQELFYRPAGGATYQSVALTIEGGGLTAVIPAEAATFRGIEYYLRFTRAQNVLTVPGSNPAENPIPLRVSVPEVAASTSVPALTYRMISVPFQVDDPDPATLLEDDYGVYDSTQWRLFRWNPGMSGYEELPALTTGFTPGTAFWISTREGGGFDTGPGRSVNTSPAFRLTLAPGWNQIGTPYAFAVAWADVTGGEVVQPPVRYDGVEYQYTQDVLEPWEGYFVFNPTAAPVELVFRPVEAAANKGGGAGDLTTRGSYVVQFQASVVGSDLRDTQTFVGLTESSPVGLDVAEAPPVGAHVRLSVVEEGTRLTASYRPASSEGQEWMLALSVTPPIEDVIPQRHRIRIRLVEHGKLPEGRALYIFDANGHSLSTSDGSFELIVEPGREERLQVIIGTETYAEQRREEIVPQENLLFQNYPNPFNPAMHPTKIGYVLHEPEWAELTLYDLLGRRVRVLSRGMHSSGYQELTWDGRDDGGREVAAGIYFYQFTAGRYRASRQLLLVR